MYLSPLPVSVVDTRRRTIRQSQVPTSRQGSSTISNKNGLLTFITLGVGSTSGGLHLATASNVTVAASVPCLSTLILTCWVI